MNALAPIAQRSLPATMQSPPHLSPDLGYLVQRLIEAPEQPPMLATRALRVEARAAADRLRKLLTPVDADTVRRWLLPINAAVRRPLAAEDFAARAAAIAITVSGLPSRVFTVPTQREAMQTFRIFPAAADICGLLEPYVADLRRPLHALQRVAASADADGGPRASSEEAVAGFARIHAAIADAAPPAVDIPRPAPRAAYLSRAMLDAMRAGRAAAQGPS